MRNLARSKPWLKSSLLMLRVGNTTHLYLPTTRAFGSGVLISRASSVSMQRVTHCWQRLRNCSNRNTWTLLSERCSPKFMRAALIQCWCLPSTFTSATNRVARSNLSSEKHLATFTLRSWMALEECGCTRTISSRWTSSEASTGTKLRVARSKRHRVRTNSLQSKCARAVLLTSLNCTPQLKTFGQWTPCASCTCAKISKAIFQRTEVCSLCRATTLLMCWKPPWATSTRQSLRLLKS